MPAAIHSVAAPMRGVFKVRGKILGRNAYYARTLSGELIGGGVHAVTALENDAQICHRLRCELDAADPVKHLRLLPRTVTASIDGPSLSHPSLLAAEEDISGQLREMIETVQRDWPLSESAAVMPDVAQRLLSLLSPQA